MLKEPSPQQYQFAFETITLDELVPEDHLVRKIDAAIDFEFIRDAVAHLYCPDNGRPAIDPVHLIKMMLLGYLFGVPSERRLVKEIQVNVAYRWFLRMGLLSKVTAVSRWAYVIGSFRPIPSCSSRLATTSNTGRGYDGTPVCASR